MPEQRYSMWAGAGTKEGLDWMIDTLEGRKPKNKDPIDAIWPIVDTEAGHVIDGYPSMKQMVCVCFSAQDQRKVADLMNLGELINRD